MLLKTDSLLIREPALPITAQEAFINPVLASVDQAIACELARLNREEGVTPACREGCDYCCRFYIVMAGAEAHALCQYIRREMSVEEIAALQERTRHWHEWDASRPGRPPSTHEEKGLPPADYDPCCPMLVDGRCSAYPVRPVTCRIHHVSSPPSHCRAINYPEEREAAPCVLASIERKACIPAEQLKDAMGAADLACSQAKMLLPHWLAIEMGWDFAIQ